MPKVPIYDRQFLAVKPIGQRYASDAPVEAFGGGRATLRYDEAFGNVARPFQEIFEKEARRADFAVATELENELMNLESQLQNEIALNYQGEKSFEARDFANEKWVESVNKIKERVQNANQWDSFLMLESRARERMHRFLGNHEAVEYQKFENMQFESNIKNYENLAVKNYTNPQQANQYINEGVARIVEFDRRRGLSPEAGEPSEVTKQKIRDFKSGVVVSTFERLLMEGDFERAKDYFEVYKDEINEKAVRAINESISVHEPIYIADQIFERLNQKRGVTGNISLSLAESELRKLDHNPQMQKKVRAHLNALLENDRQRIRIERNEEDVRVLIRAIEIKQNKGSVHEAITIAEKSFGNLLDKQRRIDIVQKLFKEDYARESNPDVYIRFYTDATLGSLDVGQLKKAFDDKLLSKEDYLSLLKHNINVFSKAAGSKVQQFTNLGTKVIREAFPREEERAAHVEFRFKQILSDKNATGELHRETEQTISTLAQRLIDEEKKRKVTKEMISASSSINKLKEKDFDSEVVDAVHRYLLKKSNLQFEEEVRFGRLPVRTAPVVKGEHIVELLSNLATSLNLPGGIDFFKRGNAGSYLIKRLLSTKDSSGQNNAFSPNNFKVFYEYHFRAPQSRETQSGVEIDEAEAEKLSKRRFRDLSLEEQFRLLEFYRKNKK